MLLFLIVWQLWHKHNHGMASIQLQMGIKIHDLKDTAGIRHK